MKKHIRLLALALASIMTAGIFASCNSGDGGNSDSSASNSESSVSSTAPESEDSEEDSSDSEPDAAGTGVFDSEVTLRVPVYDRGIEGVPNVSDNYWTNWIQENFGDKNNIKVEFVPITRSDVMTDYALLASSKNLPTILMEYDYPRLAQWAADGYLATFDMDEFAGTAPNYHQVMVDNDLLNFSQMNGETYFALAQRPNWDTAFTYMQFVRMDWLKEIGYDHIPLTGGDYDDYIAAMTKIKEAGLAEHPMGGEMLVAGIDQNYGFREFPENEEEWAMYSPVSIPALGWKPNYELVKRANAEFNAGLSNPEYYITDAESAKAAFINGETYKYGGYLSGTMDWLNSFYEQNPDAELAIEPIPTEDNEKYGTTPLYRADNPFGMIVGFSSTATEDEIKAAWMYMEWMIDKDVMYEMQWGVEGENFEINAETNLPESFAEYEGEYKQGYNNNKDYWCISIESRDAGTPEEMIANIVPTGLPQDFTQGVVDYYHQKVELADKGYASNDTLFSVILDSEVEYGTALVELYKEYRDTLTMCSPEEFDTLYEDLAQKYLDQGFQQVIDERKAAYEAGNSTKIIK